jgi:hypothetical protein
MSTNIPLSPHEHVIADLSKMLADRDWVAASNEDFSALDDVARFMFDTSAHIEKPVNISELLDELITKTRPAARLETPAPNYSLDDQLAAQLAARDWIAVTADDVAALDALKREIFETRIFVEPVISFEAMLVQFISRNTPQA